MKALYFREGANRDGDTIIFIHGGGIGGQVWSSTLQELTEYHCLAPDMPGFGRSTHLAPFSLESTVEGLANLIRTRAPAGRAAVVGFSVGAVVAIGLMEQHPKLVEKAFISGPTPELGRLTTQMMNTFARPMISLMRSKGGGRFLAHSMGLTDELSEEFREEVDRLSPDLFFQINAVVANQDFPHQSTTPAVIFAGEKEIGAVKKRARQLMRAYENSQCYLVRNLGHMWCLENPALFHETVRDWMSGTEFSGAFVRLTD